MRIRKYLWVSSILLAVAMLGVTTEVRAQRGELPLECTTVPDGRWRVRAIPGPDNEFPRNLGPCNGTDACVAYTYEITALSPELMTRRVVVAVAADQNIISTSPAQNVDIFAPCQGTVGVGFIRRACHEFAVLFRRSPRTVELVMEQSSAILTSIAVVGRLPLGEGTERLVQPDEEDDEENALLRLSTVRVVESCAIAGPGRFDVEVTQAVTTAQMARAGNCEVMLRRDPSGKIVGISTDTPGCTVDRNGVDVPSNLVVNGQAVSFIGEAQLTTGTSTCYSWFSGGRWYAISTVSPSDCPR